VGSLRRWGVREYVEICMNTPSEAWEEDNA